jgi:hypothetical protein
MALETKDYKELFCKEIGAVAKDRAFDLGRGLQECDRALLETDQIIHDAVNLEWDDFSPPTLKVFPTTWISKAVGCSYNTLITFGDGAARRFRWERYHKAGHVLLFLETTSIQNKQLEMIRKPLGLLLERVRSYQLQLENQVVIPAYVKRKYSRETKVKRRNVFAEAADRMLSGSKPREAVQCVMDFHEESGAPDERIVGLQIHRPAFWGFDATASPGMKFVFSSPEDYGNEFLISLVLAGDLGRKGEVKFNLSYEHPVGVGPTRFCRGPRTTLGTTATVFMNVDKDFNRRAEIRVPALDLPSSGFLWITPVINGRTYEANAQAWPVKRGKNPSFWEFIRMKPDC